MTRREESAIELHGSPAWPRGQLCNLAARYNAVDLGWGAVAIHFSRPEKYITSLKKTVAQADLVTARSRHHSNGFK